MIIKTTYNRWYRPISASGMGRRFIVVLGQCRWFLAVVHCGSLPKAQSRDPTDSNPVFDPSSSTSALLDGAGFNQAGLLQGQVLQVTLIPTSATCPMADVMLEDARFSPYISPSTAKALASKIT